MVQTYEDKSLEDWANFNFAEAEEIESESDAQTDEQQTSLPDQLVEDEPTESDVAVEPQDAEPTESESKSDAQGSETTESEAQDLDPTKSAAKSSELTAPPAYQGLEIPIAEVKVYKRPHMKALFFGSGALIVALVVGMLFARGSNLELGQKPDSTIQGVEKPEEQAEEDSTQDKLSHLEGEVAFGELKNRAQILEEQKKQKILSGKLAKQAEEARADQASSNTVSLPPSPSRPVSRSSSSFPRLPYSAPSRVVPPVSRPSSGSIPPGSPSSSSAPIPPAPVPPAPTPASVTRQPPEPPTMLSFGAMPTDDENNAISGSPAPSTQGGFQTVAQSTREPAGSSFDSDLLLAQQEEAFLSGKSQFLIESGQSVSGEVTQQIIAAQDAAFTVKVSEGVLGLPSGSEVSAQVTQFSGKYLVAEAVSIRHIDGSTTMIPPGAVTLSDSNGKLLKAKSNKGFFQSGVGKALLGAGSGLADQLTRRSESFSQNRFGTTVTRGAGSRDLATLGSSALQGFADPLLNQAGAGEESAALLLNPGQKVRLNINSSFVVSQ